MISITELKTEFEKRRGIMKTSELNGIGLNSRQILRLEGENILLKIKRGFYEFSDIPVPDEVMIAKLFPSTVIYLESALQYYGYSDRIPASWQLAVDKNISKSQFKISYPPVKPFYLDSKYINTGIDEILLNGAKVRIFNRERTICDVLRYANKLDPEIFNNAIRRYIKDTNRNIKRLIEYATKLRVTNKVKTYVEIWL